MSAPDTPQLPPKPEVKQKPPVPTKPSNNTPDTSSETTASQNSGNVKKIVNIFSQPESKISSGSAGKITRQDRRAQRPPTVKPRRKTKSSSQTGAGKAPPLPPKTRQNHSGQKEEVESKEDCEASKQDGRLAAVCNDGGRSAPDGKEGGKPRAEQDSSPFPEPQCEKNCSCLCHLQRPGMKLIWVPISEKEDDEGEDDEIWPDPEIGSSDEEDQSQKEGEEEIEAGEQDNPNMEAESLSEAENNSDEPLTSKLVTSNKFHETRSLIEQQLRRKSDPGPLIIPVVRFPQTPLNVPKTQSLEDPDESVYEFSLDVVTPARPQKGSDTLTSKDAPPAIPPRMPLDNRCSPRLITPQPLARPGSPLLPPPKSSPPASPRPQKTPPPPPIKSYENGRRPSSYSLQSVDETDGAGPDEGKCGSNELKLPRVLPRKQRSFDSEAGGEGYLYQFYTKTYISKEIRRTVCRNISKTSIDFQMDPRNTASSEKGAEGARSSPVPNTQNNLWQNLPKVQDSGVLQSLTPEECKYQESMFEVIASERSYLRSLCVLTEHFMESSDLNDTLITRDRKTLFSNILRIQEVSERFLKDLEERLDESIIISDLCDIIHYHAQHHFPAYIDYVRNQVYQDKTYTSLLQSNAQFAAIISRLQESPVCQRLPFMSFLLLPFQRITRIKMLIENILKRTAVGTDEEQTASKALDSVSKIIEECNTQVGKMRQMEELIEINGMLEFDKLKAVPIISQTRHLEKRGELQEVNRGGVFLTLRPRFTPVYLFLFNDLLVIAKKSSERYVVLDHAHRSLVQVQCMGEDTSVPSLENCFCLNLLENHQGRHVERVLKAPTKSDLHRWLAVFPNPNDPNKGEEEVIYEDWDCPQVQCVEQYVANQADELNLEPTEIVNVVRKTNEGWYEGIRLSDGQKGWFPVANVLEITNEHVRRRNLRERYRVMQAASIVAKNHTIPKANTS